MSLNAHLMLLRCYPKLLHFKTFISEATVPIITKPVSWTEKHIRWQEKENTRKFKQKMHAENLKDKEVLITCTNKKFNLYKGTQYGKFEMLPLASKSWKNRKSVGDTFTINPSSKNPALLLDGTSFLDCGLNENIVCAINKIGFNEPTNVQAAAIPVITSGQNTLIAAETGNGKTLAFVAPLLQELHMLHNTGALSDVPLNSPSLIIIAPGRELALQIKEVCASLARNLSLNVDCILGGDHTKLKMRYPTVKRMDVLVATPGVLTKLFATSVIRTQHVRHVVLDEADTLLDDSFHELSTQILKKMPIRSGSDLTSGVQLVLVGATQPRSLSSMLGGIVEVDSLQRVATPTLHHLLPHVMQRFHRLSPQKKVEKIIEMAKSADVNKKQTIIFSNSAKTAHWLGLTLKEHNINCIHIGGKQDSRLRKLMYKMFLNGEAHILSSTDIISRGMDTINVGHVINYEFPEYVSDYIHRSGRVGRVGSAHSVPLVTSLVSKEYEVDLVQSIEVAARRRLKLSDVNANIKRLFKDEMTKRDEEREIISEMRSVRQQMRDVRRTSKAASTSSEVP